jgi:hypothetical protein
MESSGWGYDFTTLADALCTVDWHEQVEASSNDAHWIVLGKTRSLALFWFEGWV